MNPEEILDGDDLIEVILPIPERSLDQVCDLYAQMERNFMLWMDAQMENGEWE